MIRDPNMIRYFDGTGTVVDRTESNRIEPNRTESNRIEPNRGSNCNTKINNNVAPHEVMCNVSCLWFLLCFGSGRCFHAISRPSGLDIVAGLCRFFLRELLLRGSSGDAQQWQSVNAANHQDHQRSKKRPTRRWKRLWEQV